MRTAIIISCSIAALLITATLDLVFSANQKVEASSKLRVLASFYPLYEFAKNVGLEKVEVITLIPIGTEPHDWEPNPILIQQLGKVDVALFNGFEPWKDKIRENNDIVFIEMIEGLKVNAKDELIKSEESEEFRIVDPHIWLDPVLVKEQVLMIRDTFMQVDPANAEYYKDNADSYITKLESLDARIRSELSNCKSVFVSFHNAFAYFAKRYNLEVISLTGMIPEGEILPADLRVLIDFIKSNNIKIIYSDEFLDPRLAEVIARDTGAKVMILSPIEGLTEGEMTAGVTYIQKMKENVQNLKEGLCK